MRAYVVQNGPLQVSRDCLCNLCSAVVLAHQTYTFVHRKKYKVSYGCSQAAAAQCCLDNNALFTHNCYSHAMVDMILEAHGVCMGISSKMRKMDHGNISVPVTRTMALIMALGGGG